jgi:hypothetical protein
MTAEQFAALPRHTVTLAEHGDLLRDANFILRGCMPRYHELHEYGEIGYGLYKGKPTRFFVEAEREDGKP